METTAIIKTNSHKAYRLIVDDLDEPWHYNDIIVYASTAGEAKSKGISEFANTQKRDIYEYDGWREVKYTDIRAIRHKEFDKALYSGSLLTMAEIREAQWCKERDEKALELTISSPNALCVVWAGVYNSYWGSNKSGYASSIEWAGKYTTKEAYEIVRGSDYQRKEEVKLLDVEKYNFDIKKQISDMEEKFVKEKNRLNSAIITT